MPCLPSAQVAQRFVNVDLARFALYAPDSGRWLQPGTTMADYHLTSLVVRAGAM